MRTANSRAARRQRQKRGVVVVEALIAVSFFTTILIGALFAHRVCKAKLRVMNEARTAAWVHGINGCKDQAVRGQSFGSTASGIAQEDMAVPDDALSGTLTVNDKSATKTQYVSGMGPFLGLDVSGKSSVACNDVPTEATGVDSLFKLFAQSPF